VIRGLALLALLTACGGGEAWAQCGGINIDTVVIENAGAEGGILGALHVTTRAGVIRGTVLVRPGDCYDAARVAEGERALWALGIFRAIHVDTTRMANGRLALHVATSDGWTARPVADYTRAGTSHSWSLGFYDGNFLGTASHALASYGATPDRSTFAVEYGNPHFLRPGATVWARHAELSNGTQTVWSAALPFRETASRGSATFFGALVEEHALQYGDHVTILDSRSRLRWLRLDAGYAALATSLGYVRLWSAAVWREISWSPSDTTPYRPDAFTTLGGGIELARGHYRTTQGLNAYGRPEFVSLSDVLRLGVWAARRAFGYPASRAGTGGEAQLQLGVALPRGHAVLRAYATGAFVDGRLDSGQVRSQAMIVLQPSRRHTLLLYGDAGRMVGRLPPGIYDLWLEHRGPRLFAPHAFMGARMWWAVAEERTLVAASAVRGQVAVGIAPFFEYARAWQLYGSSAVASGGNVGVALRLVPLKFGTTDVPEVAVGYRFGNARSGARWALGVRSGIAL
jgi:hypothetical protein